MSDGRIINRGGTAHIGSVTPALLGIKDGMLPHRQTKVLCVEDNPFIQECVVDEMEEAGFLVTAADDGVIAFGILQSTAASFDVVVSDVNLGKGPDGWQVAGLARKLNPAIGVLYVSAASGHEWSSKGVRNSILLEKPLASGQLVASIRAIVEKRRLGVC